VRQYSGCFGVSKIDNTYYPIDKIDEKPEVK
jgi:hypothetical protein